MKVLIATKNQGKIEGAKKALEHYFKDVEIKGIPVEVIFISKLQHYVAKIK